jgi:hypothetical protein
MRFFIATLLSAHNIVAQESFMADEVFMSVAAWAVMHHDARLLFSFIARRCVVCLCFSFATFFFFEWDQFRNWKGERDGPMLHTDWAVQWALRGRWQMNQMDCMYIYLAPQA